MAVVKGPQSGTLTREAIVLDLSDLGRQAQKLREQAEARARAIIEESQRKAADLASQAREEALTEGRAEGYAKGQAEGRQQGHAEALAQHSQSLQQIEQAWQSAMQSFDGQRVQMEREAKQAVLDLALCMARKVVHRVIEVDSTVAVDQVASALEHVMRPMAVRVCIHPEDKASIEEALPRLTREFANVQHIELIEDETMGRGGCIVQYGQGVIDATVERQLDRVVRLILPTGGSVERSMDVPAEAGAPEASEGEDEAELDGIDSNPGEQSDADADT